MCDGTDSAWRLRGVSKEQDGHVRHQVDIRDISMDDGRFAPCMVCVSTGASDVDGTRHRPWQKRESFSRA